MEIRICSYLLASYVLQADPSAWDALVILDSNVKPTEFVDSHTRRRSYLWFDDIEQSIVNRRVVTSEQIAEGLEFATGSSRLLVCCRAGQSRSAALAYVIACREFGAQSAIELLDPRRHIPNRLVVRLGAVSLNSHSVFRVFDNWRETHRHIALSDYYNEIASEIDNLAARGVVDRIVHAAS